MNIKVIKTALLSFALGLAGWASATPIIFTISGQTVGDFNGIDKWQARMLVDYDQSAYQYTSGVYTPYANDTYNTYCFASLLSVSADTGFYRSFGAGEDTENGDFEFSRFSAGGNFGWESISSAQHDVRVTAFTGVEFNQTWKVGTYFSDFTLFLNDGFGNISTFAYGWGEITVAETDEPGTLLSLLSLLAMMVVARKLRTV